MNVVLCPPSKDTVRFDPHQFAERKNYLRTSRLAFTDMQRAHILRVGDRKPVRRTSTPAWAMNDEALREVLANYLEGRLYIRDCSGAPAERIARCRKEAESRLPRRRACLRELIERYRELSRLPDTKTAALRRLEQHIANIGRTIGLKRLDGLFSKSLNSQLLVPPNRPVKYSLNLIWFLPDGAVFKEKKREGNHQFHFLAFSP